MGEKIPEEQEGEAVEVASGVGQAALRGLDFAEHAGSTEFVGVDGLDELPTLHSGDFRRTNRRGAG